MQFVKRWNWTASSLLRHVSRAAQNSSRQCPRHFSLLNYRRSIHQDVIHSLRELIGIFEGRKVAHGGGIEDHYIGPHSGLEHATISQAQALRRKRRKFTNRILDRQRVILADILSQNARKRAVGARMRVLQPQNAFGEVPEESLSMATQGCW